MKTSNKVQNSMCIVLGSHTIKAFVACPEQYKVLGIVRMGMEFGLLATTQWGSYVRVNGSAVSALDSAEVEKALQAACAKGRGESYATSRSHVAANAPHISLRKHRHVENQNDGGLFMTGGFEMDARKIMLLRESWALVPWKSEALSGNFYIHLFNVAPVVQTAYAGNKINAVSGMLGFMGVAISMLDDLESLENMLRQAGPRHAGYGALPSYYPAIGDALLLTLEGALGEKFTPETREAWVGLYQFMSNCMTQSVPPAHEPPTASALTALHLDDLLEDSGPHSDHVPLFESAGQEVLPALAVDASQAGHRQTSAGQLHLLRPRPVTS